MPPRLAVLASGRGSNLQAIIEHFDSIARERIAKVVLVASNRPDSPALIRAATASIDIASFDAADDGSQLLETLRRFRVDMVVLAGYLKRIPPRAVTMLCSTHTSASSTRPTTAELPRSTAKLVR